MFADDTEIYLTGKDIKYIACQLHRDLDLTSKACFYKNMCISVSTSKSMLFGNGFGACNVEWPDFSLCNGVVGNVKSYNFLGNIIVENVKFNEDGPKINPKCE